MDQAFELVVGVELWMVEVVLWMVEVEWLGGRGWMVEAAGWILIVDVGGWRLDVGCVGLEFNFYVVLMTQDKCLRLLSTSIQHPTSNIEHASNIEHRTSNTQYPTSNTQITPMIFRVLMRMWWFLRRSMLSNVRLHSNYLLPQFE